MHCARAGAAAIAAVLAFSPTLAEAPKPIVDLSQSPAVSGKEAAPAAKSVPAPAQSAIGPLDEQTLALGGGAIAVLALGGGAFALSRRKRRRDAAREAERAAAEAAVKPRDPLFDEPMFRHEPARTEPSAFGWDDAAPCDQSSDDGSDRCPGETWFERAYRGPSPANPSASLKHRLSRAAFFDKRERDVAAGRAEPIEPGAGLPEAMVEEQERELA